MSASMMRVLSMFVMLALTNGELNETEMTETNTTTNTITTTTTVTATLTTTYSTSISTTGTTSAASAVFETTETNTTTNTITTTTITATPTITYSTSMSTTGTTTTINAVSETADMNTTTNTITTTITVTATITTAYSTTTGTTLTKTSNIEDAKTTTDAAETTSIETTTGTFSSTRESSEAPAAIVTGQITMTVVNAKAFAADVAVQLAIAKSIAQQAQCPPTWVTVSISVVDRRRLGHATLRRMQIDASTVDIDYSIKVLTTDGSESSEAKAGAEARATAMIEGLSGIEQDAAAFKSVVEAEFQLAGVDYEVAEVTGSSTDELTRTWEEDQAKANMCTRQSLGLAMGMVVLPLVW